MATPVGAPCSSAGVRTSRLATGRPRCAAHAGTAHAGILSALVEDVRDRGGDGIDNDFTLQEFLDRYGMRLGQMSHLLNLVSPLAEMAQHNEPS